MQEVEINKKYLDEFVKNLRKEDKEEILECYGDNLTEFFEICLNKKYKTYFLLADDNKPLALGGVFDVAGNLEKEARIWFLMTDNKNFNKLAFSRYIKNKILNFQKDYDLLFNYIYKSNFSALKWLIPLGFKVIDINMSDYKLFYFAKKGGIIYDFRYFACK